MLGRSMSRASLCGYSGHPGCINCFEKADNTYVSTPRRSLSTSNCNMIGPVATSLCMYAVETFKNRIGFRTWSTSSPQRLVVYFIIMGRILSEMWVEILVEIIEDSI